MKFAKVTTYILLICLFASLGFADNARRNGDGSDDSWIVSGKATAKEVGNNVVPPTPTATVCSSDSDCRFMAKTGDTTGCTAMCIKRSGERTGECRPTGRVLCPANSPGGAGRCANTESECRCSQSCGACSYCDSRGECKPLRESGDSGPEYTLRRCESGMRCLLPSEECPEACRSNALPCSACERCVRDSGSDKLRCEQPGYLQDTPCKSGACIGHPRCPEICLEQNRRGYYAHCDSCTERCYSDGGPLSCRPAEPAHLRCADGRCVKADEIPQDCYPTTPPAQPTAKR